MRTGFPARYVARPWSSPRIRLQARTTRPSSGTSGAPRTRSSPRRRWGGSGAGPPSSHDLALAARAPRARARRPGRALVLHAGGRGRRCRNHRDGRPYGSRCRTSSARPPRKRLRRCARPASRRTWSRCRWRRTLRRARSSRRLRRRAASSRRARPFASTSRSPARRRLLRRPRPRRRKLPRPRRRQPRRLRPSDDDGSRRAGARDGSGRRRRGPRRRGARVRRRGPPGRRGLRALERAARTGRRAGSARGDGAPRG